MHVKIVKPSFPLVIAGSKADAAHRAAPQRGGKQEQNTSEEGHLVCCKTTRLQTIIVLIFFINQFS
jgi:hypothetical protein